MTRYVGPGLWWQDPVRFGFMLLFLILVYVGVLLASQLPDQPAAHDTGDPMTQGPW